MADNELGSYNIGIDPNTSQRDKKGHMDPKMLNFRNRIVSHSKVDNRWITGASD